MKIPNKRELQQVVHNHSSGIDFKGFMNLHKNVLQNHIFFFIINDPLASVNPLRFRNNLLERI